jgi:hypothetical protein
VLWGELILQPPNDPAIVPRPVAPNAEAPILLKLWRPPGVAWWLRGAFTLAAGAWLVVFGVAIYLDPYQGGKVHLMEVHRQLGMNSCTFKLLTEMPCPSCGMTTSFALLVRGDLVNSVRANCAGTMLAFMGMFAIVWCSGVAWTGRWIWSHRPDVWFVRLTVLFVVTMFVRWGIVLLVLYSQRS